MALRHGFGLCLPSNPGGFAAAVNTGVVASGHPLAFDKLVTGGAAGWLLDASLKEAVMASDSAGATPVTGATDPLGRFFDSSGNGLDFNQTLSYEKPSLIDVGAAYAMLLGRSSENRNINAVSGVPLCDASGNYTKVIVTKHVLVGGYPDGNGAHLGSFAGDWFALSPAPHPTHMKLRRTGWAIYEDVCPAIPTGSYHILAIGGTALSGADCLWVEVRDMSGALLAPRGYTTYPYAFSAPAPATAKIGASDATSAVTHCVFDMHINATLDTDKFGSVVDYCVAKFGGL